MSYWSVAFSDAFHLIEHPNAQLKDALDNTVEVALVSTGIATVLGLPLGLSLGLGRFRGRGAALAVSNAGLGMPPVVVGIIFVLLLIPHGLLGGLHWLFTLKGVILAQTVLGFPVVVALTAAAVGNITGGLLDQARGFDARLWRVWALAMREARVGVVAAIVAAFGTALSEVAAVVLVGGNIDFADQTLGSLALEQIDAGNFVYGLAIGIVLLALILAVSIVLTTLQYVGRRPARRGRR